MINELKAYAEHNSSNIAKNFSSADSFDFDLKMKIFCVRTYAAPYASSIYSILNAQQTDDKYRLIHREENV